MKRLTIHEIKEYIMANYFDGDENVDACVDGDEEITVMANIVKSLDKLVKYEDLEEQGRLIKLPCKVGDKVYVIEEIFPSKRSLYKRRVKEIDISSINFFLDEIFIHDYDGFDYLMGELFFTREEAEEALKGE